MAILEAFENGDLEYFWPKNIISKTVRDRVKRTKIWDPKRILEHLIPSFGTFPFLRSHDLRNRKWLISRKR